MIEIRKLTEDSENVWKKFVEKTSGTKIQHILEWKKAIENTYPNCIAYYYMFYEKNKLKAIIPFFLVKSPLFGNRLMSLPFIDNGGFAGVVNEQMLEVFVDKVKKDITNLSLIQIRLNSKMKNYNKLEKWLIKNKFKKNLDRHQFILDLKDSDKLWKTLSKSTKRMINTAEKNNLSLREISLGQELDKFYELYFKRMKLFGTPPHSKEFFKNLWKNASPKNIKGLNCYKKNKLLASMICYLHKDYIYYIYSTSLNDKESLQMRPNEFLYWNFIKWSADNKYSFFDFGQAEVNAEKGNHAEGLYNFKKKWGGEIYERPYFDYSLNKKDNGQDLKKYKKMILVWRKLPSSLIKIIGPRVCAQLGL